MDLIESTQESISSATDFFSTPPVALTEEESYFMKIHPTSSIDNNAPLIYEFDVDDSHYADLNNCFHHAVFKLLKDNAAIAAPGDAQQPGDNHKVAPINYFGNTLFQNAELYLNGEMVETSNNLYPYKSFMQAFLSFDVETKNHQLALGGYYADTGDIDTDAIRTAMATDACDNKGLHKRYDLSKNSTPFSALSPLHLDFCTQNRYVQNRTSVKIRLTRVDPKFGLVANTATKNFTFTIQHAYLLVRMVKPRESLRLAVEQALASSKIKYPLKRCEMRFFTFAGNSNTLSEPTLYSGHLPTRVALGLVDTDSLDGDWKKSPFNFKPLQVNEIDLKMNGKSVTNDPLKIDLTNNDYALPYFWMYYSTGGLYNNESLVSYDQFKKGHFLYVFDLTEDGEHGLDHFHQPKSGVLSLNMRVSAPPGNSVSLVAMFEREIMITCDQDRNYKVTG